MGEWVAAIGAVSAITAQSPSAASAALDHASRMAASMPTSPSSPDVAAFRSMVQEPGSAPASSEVSGKLVDAGVSLSHRYADRIGAAHELSSVSADSLGVDHGDYMRAMLSVQIALNEVTVELQSTAQIANSVKDSFNALYRLQG